MKSLESKLAECVGKMSEAQREKFMKTRTYGASTETVLNLAESVLGEEPVRAAIRRNNGGQAVQEAEYSMDKADAMLIEGLRSRGCLPQGTVECQEASALQGAARKDYEFCRLIGMSESDSLKSASKVL